MYKMILLTPIVFFFHFYSLIIKNNINYYLFKYNYIFYNITFIKNKKICENKITNNLNKLSKSNKSYKNKKVILSIYE